MLRSKKCRPSCQKVKVHVIVIVLLIVAAVDIMGDVVRRYTDDGGGFRCDGPTLVGVAYAREGCGRGRKPSSVCHEGFRVASFRASALSPWWVSIS